MMKSMLGYLLVLTAVVASWISLGIVRMGDGEWSMGIVSVLVGAFAGFAAYHRYYKVLVRAASM